jgi:hypothetical protein
MSPSSIASYEQTAHAAPPPNREASQSLSDKVEEDEKSKRVKSEAGDDRGKRIDIDT